ncbi:MAG: hypothetical protein U0457_19390 [Candidatus Sericytochromatia bacterium]
MPSISSLNQPLVVQLNSGIAKTDFKEKVDKVLSDKRITKEEFESIAKDMKDGGKSIKDLLAQISPNKDVEKAFKSGGIEVTDVQKKKLLSIFNKAQEDNSQGFTVRTALSNLNLDSLGKSNTTFIGKEFELKAGFSVGASLGDLGVMGIQGKVQVGAETSGSTKYSAELAKDGKVTLNFETLVKGGLGAEASVGVVGLAEFGGNGKAEAGYLVKKSYTFSSLEEAKKFVESGGKGFEQAKETPAKNTFVLNHDKGEPVGILKGGYSKTVIVNKTSTEGILGKLGFTKSLSKQAFSTSLLSTPSGKEIETSLETNKGDSSSVKSKVVYQKNPATGKNELVGGNIDLSINFAKIGKSRDLEAMIDKMADRLVSVSEGSNKTGSNEISLTKDEARKIVKKGIDDLVGRYSDMTAGKKAAATYTLPIPFVNAVSQNGGMLNMNFKLEKGEDGKLKLSAPVAQLRSKEATSLGVSFNVLPFAKASLSMGKATTTVQTFTDGRPRASLERAQDAERETSRDNDSTLKNKIQSYGIIKSAQWSIDALTGQSLDDKLDPNFVRDVGMKAEFNDARDAVVGQAKGVAKDVIHAAPSVVSKVGDFISQFV